MLLRENERRIREMTNSSLIYDWDDIAQSIAQKLGVGFNLSIELLVNRYAKTPYVSIIGNSKAVIRRLKKSHRLIVAATNGLSKYQLPVLQALKLTEMFDSFLTPDITGYLKGDRRFYGNFLDSPSIPISIGDSYQFDIVRPKKLGMYTIWVNTEMKPSVIKKSPFERIEFHRFLKNRRIRPDAIVNEINELTWIIQKIEANR